MATKEEMKKEGYTVYCLACHTCYKETPMENYEDGHGDRQIPMCRCGCDLFDKF